jgi:hypothetical protein
MLALLLTKWAIKDRFICGDGNQSTPPAFVNQLVERERQLLRRHPDKGYGKKRAQTAI